MTTMMKGLFTPYKRPAASREPSGTGEAVLGHPPSPPQAAGPASPRTRARNLANATERILADLAESDNRPAFAPLMEYAQIGRYKKLSWREDSAADSANMRKHASSGVDMPI